MIRVEFDHTVKVSDYKAFMRAYNAALEIDSDALEGWWPKT